MEEEEDEAEVDGQVYLGETLKNPEIQTKGD